MTIEENIYKTIRSRSKFLIENGHKWTKAISSAKNYIATPDLKYWTFGKSAGLDNEYHANGGAAKKWLYLNGFTDVLRLPNGRFKTSVLKAFRKWAVKVDAFDIIEKFDKDQANNRRFEILVHGALLPKEIIKNTDIAESNQTVFDEGFKKKIVYEITTRSRKVVDQAKEKYGDKCNVCDFEFIQKYGVHGVGFIEMHHLNPIKNGERKTTVDDLRPVCSNCHRMLHRGDRLLSINELKTIIKKQKGNFDR